MLNSMEYQYVAGGCNSSNSYIDGLLVKYRDQINGAGSATTAEEIRANLYRINGKEKGDFYLASVIAGAVRQDRG